jgi:hypothetical protein
MPSHQAVASCIAVWFAPLLAAPLSLTPVGSFAVFEVDRSGALVSTTPLASFDVVDTQGLHVDLARQRLVVGLVAQ